MSGGVSLIPNLGAEEGPGWRDAARQPRVQQMAWLWWCLFASGSRFVGVQGCPEGTSAGWPAALGPAPDAPVFPWLAELGECVAWLATEEARSLTSSRFPEAAPDPAVVARVHDKAFALKVSDEAGLTPPALRGLVHVFDTRDLHEPDRFFRRLEEIVTSWPAWTGARFTLKPRFGSSGRGRVGGGRETLDSASLRGALPRLAERGGAVLEPWLARRQDLATPMRVTASGGIHVLGSLRPWTTPAGGLLGHRGSVDSRGRIVSESEFDEPAREAAVETARAAAQQGFRGPCGVDAFSYATPDGLGSEAVALRPVVELNARFTAGLVAIGVVRRALPAVRTAIGLEPGVRRAFLLGLVAPPGEGGWAGALERAGTGAALLRLGGPEGASETALLFASADADLDAALEAREGRSGASAATPWSGSG